MLHILQVITETIKAPPPLVIAVKSLYQRRLPDPRFLIPIISAMEKEEILRHLPRLISLPSNALKSAIQRLLHSATSITPAELLVSLHTIEAKEQSQLKKVIEASQMCLEQSDIYKWEVVAVVLQQLCDSWPVPQLTMRTIIQAMTRFPKSVTFIMSLLSRLITKQIWNDKRLWEGFIRCCRMAEPESYSVLLSLPPSQLESVLSSEKDLRERFAQYCSEHEIRSHYYL